MGDSLNSRLVNLRSIIYQYNQNDRDYILNKLSDIISTNFNKNSYQISYQNLIEDNTLSQYLKDSVYKNILKVISDFNDYKILQQALGLNPQSIGTNGPTSSITDGGLINPFKVDTSNKAFNVAFNSAFTDQLGKNKIERILSEQQKLQSLIQNEKPIQKIYKPFHDLTIAEFTDNLANTIIKLFYNLFTLNFSELLSTNYYIYYGCILLLIYIIITIIPTTDKCVDKSTPKLLN